MATTHYVATADGWRLALGEFTTREPRAAVLAIPAMMVHRGSLDRPRGQGFATSLAQQGLATYTLDLRGHGEAEPPSNASRRLDWSYEDIASVDIPTAAAWVRARHPGLPFVIVGQSLGGHATTVSIGCYGLTDVDALVLVGANFWVRELEPSRLTWYRKVLTLMGFSAVTAVAGRFPSKALRMGNNDEAPTYVHSFLRWALRGAKSRDGHHDFIAGLANVTPPTLVIHGAHDRLMCTEAAARGLANRLGGPTTFWELAPDPNGLADPDHMKPLTSPDSRAIWQRIAAWIHGTVAP